MTHAVRFVATIALCGGTSRRMGVPDKTALPFGDATILDSALTGLPGGLVVCVGDSRALLPARGGEARHLVWTRENPVGGGPVAGIRAGLDAVHAELGDSPGGARLTDRVEALVAVIAGDQPFAGRAVPHLVEALTDRIGSAPTSGPSPDGMAEASPGRDGPALLLAVYRLRSLDAAIGPDATDRGVYQTLRGLNIDVSRSGRFAAEHLAIDVDDPDDLARAVALRARLPWPVDRLDP